MKIAHLHQAEAVLRRFVPNKAAGDYKLDRMRQLMQLLGNPQDKLRVVHVAGTAGKTSTCYFIAKMLQLSGQRVGLTVSPHVTAVNERVQINGKPLAEKEFCRLLAGFLETPGLEDLKPTYFEVLVAFAYWVFARQQVDYAVVEVGLGGLLDGTNVITRADKVCVITDIGFDHVEILGDTLQKIATQKAGIIQPGNAVFMLEQPTEVRAAIQTYAVKQGGHLHVLRQNHTEVPLELPLYQRRNWSLARQVSAFVAERDSLDALHLEKVDWTVPGRMERIGNFILDGAHNPGKFTALVDSLRQAYPNQKLTFIIGMIETKQQYAEECLRLIAPLAEHIWCVPAHAKQDISYRPVRPAELVAAGKRAGIQNIAALGSVASAIKKTKDNKRVVITGSLYLLGEAKAVL
jgi:dihydrofolate synthase/folylpolyglutamate synthase